MFLRKPQTSPRQQVTDAGIKLIGINWCNIIGIMLEQQPKKASCFDGLLYYLFELKLSLKLTLISQSLFILVFAIASIGIGFYLLHMAPNISYDAYDYGESPDCQSKLGKNQFCEVRIEIQKKLQSPVHMYYQLENFISNSKEYILSKSTSQLYGKPIDPNSKQAGKCMPYITNKDMGVTKSWAGQNLDPNAIASPCGMQAKLFFRDEIQLWDASRRIQVLLPESKRQFNRTPSSESTQWIDPTLDSFQIWMTNSINKTITKLYGVVNQTLEPGNYILRIKNMMNYSIFETKKSVRLTKINNEYGSNMVLGGLFIGGGVSLLIISVLRFVYDMLLLKGS